MAVSQRFALFSSRDYCVLTAPTTMNSNVSLLDHFTPVPSRVGSTFSHALFLLHRDALVADRQLAVRRFDPVAHGPQAALLLGRASEEHDPRDDLDDVSSQCDAASATAASLAATATAVACSNAVLASLAEECDVPLAENPNVAAFVAVLKPPRPANSRTFRAREWVSTGVGRWTMNNVLEKSHRRDVRVGWNDRSSKSGLWNGRDFRGENDGASHRSLAATRPRQTSTGSRFHNKKRRGVGKNLVRPVCGQSGGTLREVS